MPTIATEVLEMAGEAGMTAVMPPKKNRKAQRHYDKYLYRKRDSRVGLRPFAGMT